MNSSLEGKSAFVTGATSGIGLACARRFADLGARVALCGRRADELQRIVKELGQGSLAIPLDIRDEAKVSTAVAEAWDALEGIDYLVHAAGIVTPAALEALSAEVWRQHIDVNLNGAFYVMRECALRMRGRGRGSIVAIASDLSFKGMPNFAHYCASKAGLSGLSKSLALELAPHVRVNCICPGPVDTPMLQAELELLGGTVARDAALSQVPLKRFASADEIASFVLYVATEATFATGSMFSLDGGTTAG
jgi:NAD(P)-dependent dehydrogenase (short-subunit alcohol dehydrogenase family)